jgi:hypothetical protein
LAVDAEIAAPDAIDLAREKPVEVSLAQGCAEFFVLW